MSEVLDFRDHPEANRRWSDMRLFNLARLAHAVGIVMDGEPDTSPCEYIAPDQDSA